MIVGDIACTQWVGRYGPVLHMSHVATWSVSLCVWHTGELSKNG